MIEDFSLAKTKEFFHALSDSTRRKILSILVKKGELSVNEIVGHFSVAQPSISHHLSVLKGAGIVRFQKRGKEVFYSCNCSCLAEKWEKFFSQFQINSASKNKLRKQKPSKEVTR